MLTQLLEKAQQRLLISKRIEESIDRLIVSSEGTIILNFGRGYFTTRTGGNFLERTYGIERPINPKYDNTQTIQDSERQLEWSRRYDPGGIRYNSTIRISGCYLSERQDLKAMDELEKAVGKSKVKYKGAFMKQQRGFSCDYELIMELTGISLEKTKTALRKMLNDYAVKNRISK